MSLVFSAVVVKKQEHCDIVAGGLTQFIDSVYKSLLLCT
jgi:hypothetical protein